MDIAYVPLVERSQIVFSEVFKHDIPVGRPKLATWIKVFQNILWLYQEKYNLIKIQFVWTKLDWFWKLNPKIQFNLIKNNFSNVWFLIYLVINFFWIFLSRFSLDWMCTWTSLLLNGGIFRKIWEKIKRNIPHTEKRRKRKKLVKVVWVEERGHSCRQTQTV